MSTKLTSHLPAPRSKSKIFSTAVILDLTPPVNAAKMTSALIEEPFPILPGYFRPVPRQQGDQTANKVAVYGPTDKMAFQMNYL